ncbi:hypothetical protein Bca52824_089854 [Brassica carinata]|uniref:Uncharacterized protein n=1 Tax=Brassica carinata TaxID=52824 RepID=A0A8X7TER6_BRACI|nr:hypothetical protein Bca52824_089854 [Brassica carinata]
MKKTASASSFGPGGLDLTSAFSNPSSTPILPSHPTAAPKSPSSASETSEWPSLRPSSPKISPTRSRSSTLSPISSEARCSICSTPPLSSPH